MRELVEAVETATAGGSASTLAVDIDGFFSFTEETGTDAGDALLATAEEVMAASAAAKGWTFVRSGGDEFHVIAPDVSLEEAFLAAERLRVDLEESLRANGANGLSCTASVGVANIPRDAKTPEQLLRRANAALAAAKDQGGNAVALTPSSEMVMKTSYYEASQLARLKGLAERLGKKEAPLLREALDDLLRKYERR
jgi:diguanylate cyclase (GGDEF)-like protein